MEWIRTTKTRKKSSQDAKAKEARGDTHKPSGMCRPPGEASRSKDPQTLLDASDLEAATFTRLRLFITL